MCVYNIPSFSYTIQRLCCGDVTRRCASSAHLPCFYLARFFTRVSVHLPTTYIPRHIYACSWRWFLFYSLLGSIIRWGFGACWLGLSFLFLSNFLSSLLFPIRCSMIMGPLLVVMYYSPWCIRSCREPGAVWRSATAVEPLREPTNCQTLAVGPLFQLKLNMVHCVAVLEL